MDARFSRPMEAWSRCSPAEQVTTDSYEISSQRVDKIRFYYSILLRESLCVIQKLVMAKMQTSKIYVNFQLCVESRFRLLLSFMLTTPCNHLISPTTTQLVTTHVLTNTTGLGLI